MSWERDPLWTKSRLFFEHAFDVPREAPAFGLWCSFALELLARAALASVSPALLAEPDPNHRNLLHAVHRASEIQRPKSINAATVFQLCRKLFPEFSDEDLKVGLALLDRRNEELHSGTSAFEEYRQSQWLVAFYHACQSLSVALGETLVALFGEEEAGFAQHLLQENRDNLMKEVRGAIAAKCKAFEARTPQEQQDAKVQAEDLVRALSNKRHHKVDCPACRCAASVQGRPFGREHVREEDGQIVVTQAVSPSIFECSACGLRLGTYAALEIAGLGNPYTRTTRSSPEDYYGLINPDDLDSYVADYVAGLQEYDNE